MQNKLHEYVKSCMCGCCHIVAMKFDGGCYNVQEIQQLNDSQIARKLELIQQCHKWEMAFIDAHNWLRFSSMFFFLLANFHQVRICFSKWCKMSVFEGIWHNVLFLRSFSNFQPENIWLWHIERTLIHQISNNNTNNNHKITRFPH